MERPDKDLERPDKQEKPLTAFSYDCYRMALLKGWWETERNPLEVMALIHSEVSECVEAIRNGDIELSFAPDGKPQGLYSELADILIRVFDYCGRIGFDVDEVVKLKLEYNKNRPYRHGGKKA